MPEWTGLFKTHLTICSQSQYQGGSSPTPGRLLHGPRPRANLYSVACWGSRGEGLCTPGTLGVHKGVGRRVGSLGEEGKGRRLGGGGEEGRVGCRKGQGAPGPGWEAPCGLLGAAGGRAAPQRELTSRRLWPEVPDPASRTHSPLSLPGSLRPLQPHSRQAELTLQKPTG